MEKNNFLKTSDIETKNTLLSLGFQLIDDSNGIWTFINNVPMTFDNNDMKVTYSNILNV